MRNPAEIVGQRQAGGMAYVIDYDGSLHPGEYDGKLIPVNLASRQVGAPIALGSQPTALAISRDGSTAYVADRGGTITPVGLATGTPNWPIPVGPGVLYGITISYDGTTAYVLKHTGGGDCELAPVDLATGRVGMPIAFGPALTASAMVSNGESAWVLTSTGDDGALTPVDLAEFQPGHPIPVRGFYSTMMAIRRDGTAAYVGAEDANGRGWVIPVNLLTRNLGTPIKIGSPPAAIEIDPQGVTAYVITFEDSAITPISLAARTPGTPISLGVDRQAPMAIAITADAQPPTSLVATA